MTQLRALTDGEIAMLSPIYGDSMDYSKVRIRDGGSVQGSGFTPFNTINVGEDVYRPDYSLDPSLNMRGFFVHETAHVMQTQNGAPAFFRGIGPQFTAVLGGREEVYDYTDKLEDVIGFESWNIEEQASYFEDLYKQRFLTSNGVPLNNIPSLEVLESVDTSSYPGLKTSSGESGSNIRPVVRPDDFCFIAGTQIDMWPTDPSIQPNTNGAYDENLVLSKAWQKPIEDITPDDLVLSYDKNGHLKPGRVTRLFRNQSTHILDFWGTGVTPGHVYLCGDGEFKGQHVPIMDILRSDGALVMEDGTQIRAATGCKLGSMGDRMIHAITGETQPCGRTQIQEAGQIRLGTRVITPEGEDISVLDLVFSNGGMLTDDGYIKTDISGEKMPFRWRFSEHLPKPEDYVLQRSATTMQDIYQANEWEAVQPQMPAPAGQVAAI